MASGTQTTTAPMTPVRLARKVVFTYLSLMATVACLTVLFLSMRAVMEIGGSCASGGPYVVANPCPQGTGWMTMASIFGGLIFLGFYIGNVSGLPGPKWWGLAWPALFLSLGWNFWEFGLNPPEEFGEGVSWGWIVCGLVFVVMGAGPLLALFSKDVRRQLLWADAAEDEPAPMAQKVRDTAKAARPTFRPPHHEAPSARPSQPRPGEPSPPSSSPSPDNPYGPTRDATLGDMAEDLERLSRLHDGGHLTDSEFRAAKARRIAGYES